MPERREQRVLDEVIRRIKDFNIRIRDLEENVRNVIARINTVENAVLEKTKKLNTGQAELGDRLEELRRKVSNLETELSSLQTQTRKMVTRREFSEVENYMKLMDPVQSEFMTKDEVERLIEEKMEKMEEGD